MFIEQLTKNYRFFVPEDIIQRGYKLRSYLLDSSSSSDYPSTSQQPTTLSLSSSPSMDAFTYIIDVFTVASDDEGLPTNQEGGGTGAPPPICVIA